MPGYSHVLTSIKKKQDYDLLFQNASKLEFDESGKLRYPTAGRNQRKHTKDSISYNKSGRMVPVVTFEKKKQGDL